MEEIQAISSPPSLTSTDDFPTFGLSELGRRLITEENEPTPTTQVKTEKPLPRPPPPQPTPSVKQEKKQENKPAAQSNKKVSLMDDEHSQITSVRKHHMKILFS